MPLTTSKTRETSTSPEVQESALRRPSLMGKIAASAAFKAGVLVILANLILVLTNPFAKVDPDSLPTLKSWVFWTTQDYLNQKPNPSVVLLGSSLVMNSVWMQEAEHLQKDVDIAVNHRTQYMESVLKSHLPGFTGTCFNFGLPGAMVSDGYMIVRTLFVKEKTPKVAVICLGPRDLMDTSFSCAGATSHFKYLERYTDTKDLLDLAYTSAWPKINYMLREYIYFVGKKWHAQITTSEGMKAAMAPVLPAFTRKSLFDQKTEFDKQFAFLRSEVEKGVYIAKPNAQTVGFYDNGKDWRKRFKNPNDEMFQNQLTWLKMNLALLKEKGVQPVIVNLPMSELGLKAIRPGIYERHVQTLSALCKEQNIPYIDTMKEGRFEAADFTDYGHMDASGGKKIVDIAASKMVEFPQVKQALLGGKP